MNCTGTLAESLKVHFVVIFYNMLFKRKLCNLNSFYVEIINTKD